MFYELDLTSTFIRGSRKEAQSLMAHLHPSHRHIRGIADFADRLDVHHAILHAMGQEGSVAHEFCLREMERTDAALDRALEAIWN